MSDWKEYKLGDVAEINLNSIGKDYVFNDIEYLDTGSITKGKIDGFQYFNLKDAPSRAKRLVSKNDIIYSTVRPIQRHYGFVDIFNNNLVVSTGFAVISPIKEKANAKFLYYLLTSDDVVNYFDMIAEGSTSAYPSLRPEDISLLDISIPDLPEQFTIAEVLSSLDDKIDLLYRHNETLEKLAETLFRQWFVEEANNSWEEKTLRDLTDHHKESINPSKNPDIIFNHYSIPAFDEGKNPKREIGKKILSNKYKVISNSILVSKLNPRFPRIWSLYGNDLGENSICSTEFQIVKPKKNSDYGFIYCFLKSFQVTQELANASGGTSGSHQRVNPKDIFNLSFLLPPEHLIEQFDIITKYFWTKIKLNTNQIRTLTQLRETLLPKLISGELKVVIDETLQ